METNEKKDLEDIRKLTARYFNTLKPVHNKAELFTAEIRILNYYELAYVASNLLKLCILSLDQESPEISNTVKNPSINIGVVLEIVVQLLPMDEIEFLDEINKMLITDSPSIITPISETE